MGLPIKLAFNYYQTAFFFVIVQLGKIDMYKFAWNKKIQILISFTNCSQVRVSKIKLSILYVYLIGKKIQNYKTSSHHNNKKMI